MALPFTGLSDIAAQMANYKMDIVPFVKSSYSAPSSSAWHSLWTAAGVPAAGATDSGGTQYVNGSGGSGASANTGGFKFANTNVSPAGRILTELVAANTQPIGAICLADRLCAIGPIGVTATGSQALTTLPALPRYTNGIGVEVWLEVTTAFTTTAPQFYLDSYTGSSNSAGTNATSANAITALSSTLKVGDMVGPFPLLSPDVGVQAVASFNVLVAAGAGAVNVVLLRRLPGAISLLNDGQIDSRNLISQVPAMPIIADGATLMLMFMASNGTGGTVNGSLTSVYK